MESVAHNIETKKEYKIKCGWPAYFHIIIEVNITGCHYSKQNH